MTLSMEELEKLYLEEAVQVIHMSVDGKDAVSGWPLGHIKHRTAKLQKHLPTLLSMAKRSLELEKKYNDAADKHLALANKYSDLADENITLQAENERLREGLKPFADFASSSAFEKLPDDMPLTQGSSLALKQVTAGEFRKAFNLLKGGSNNG